MRPSQVREIATRVGYLEKLADALWVSQRAALQHAAKHAKELMMSPEQYLEEAARLHASRTALKRVQDKKLKGSLVYWDSKTGRKLVTTPGGRIVSMYYAGTRP